MDSKKIEEFTLDELIEQKNTVKKMIINILNLYDALFDLSDPAYNNLIEESLESAKTQYKLENPDIPFNEDLTHMSFMELIEQNFNDFNVIYKNILKEIKKRSFK
jgi:hypothetical protein